MFSVLEGKVVFFVLLIVLDKTTPILCGEDLQYVVVWLIDILCVDYFFLYNVVIDVEVL